MTKRTRLTAAARRNVILRAAERSFAEAGYQQTSMDDIALASGVSKPVLYDHFPSKKALFTGLLEDISGELLESGRLAPSDTGSAEQRIRAALHGFYAVVEARPSAARVMFDLPGRDADTDAIHEMVQANVSARISAQLATLFETQEPWRLAATTEFLKSGFHTLAWWWLKNPRVSREDLVDLIIAITWHGLGQAKSDQ